MNKVSFLAVLALGILIFSCNPSPNKKNVTKKEEGFTLTGQLVGFPDSTMIYIDKDMDTVSDDSTLLVNGKFAFNGKVDIPSITYIRSKYIAGTKQNLNTFIWLENSNIELFADTADMQKIKVTGSEMQLIADELKNITRPFEEKRNELVQLYFQNPETNNYIWADVKVSDSLSSVATLNFIKGKPNNYVSMMWLHELRSDIHNDTIKAILAKLTPEMLAIKETISLQEHIKSSPVNKNDDYREVSGQTLNGETLKLSDALKGKKVTLLDFWSSGCQPCRMQNIQLLKNYKKYSEKGFEIVSFSLDKNKDSWSKASIKDSITWVNISDLKAYHSTNVLRYQINSIPNGFLIDENGKVIHRYGGYSAENDPLTTHLEEIFGF